ncbi:MAG TPA: hypothetical protein VHP14_17245 [Anaerolineales bacterium]|nr:hypothetical protein [Anaerolineales bacterium]
MKRAFFAFIFCTLLSACAANAPSPSAIPPSTILPATAVPSPTFDVETTAVPIRPQDCGYQWAHGDLPELSSSFQQSIQALQPEATAGAYAFGENCVRADGTIANFLAMETDFNVSLHVDDLANESVLGKWIVQVMQVIEDIPPDQVAGPRPGHVSIVFQSSTAQAVINFYINQYQELPSSLNYAEIYEALKTLQ